MVTMVTLKNAQNQIIFEMVFFVFQSDLYITKINI